jgi:hypothetical protein
MSKPTTVKLSKSEQKAVLKSWKKQPNARAIAEQMHLPRHHVMFFVESQGLARYSEGSYR